MVARERNLQSDGDNRQNTESRQGHPCTRHVSLNLWDPTADLLHSTTFQQLHTSGWYWGDISAAEAKIALQDALEGTFLVRDSSHPLYMLTLSVKTCRGPTSVRIEYNCGHFRLDSSSPARSSLPSFTSVPSLVQHYVGSGRRHGGGDLEEEGAKSWESVMPKDNTVLLKLQCPLRRPQAFPSLQHLTRLVINRHASSPAHLPLPGPLLLFLHEYPFYI
ncbi:cytokine-inducible SH2-containing protein-like isoform X2 [Clupea harengus]|nr:cytokine-inducible SH2-containing protein-like isoform X2 [Clupea harengus]